VKIQSVVLREVANRRTDRKTDKCLVEVKINLGWNWTAGLNTLADSRDHRLGFICIVKSIC